MDGERNRKHKVEENHGDVKKSPHKYSREEQKFKLLMVLKW